MLSDYIFVLVSAMTVLEPQHAMLSLLKQRKNFTKQRNDFLKLCLAQL